MQSNSSKKFLIQFESSAETRWLYLPPDVAEALRRLAETVAKAHTAGPKPAVTVTIEEDTPAAVWKPI